MPFRIALLLAAAACASCGAFTPSAETLRNDPHGHLVWAARTGDASAIRTLAASGVDLDSSGATAAMVVFPDFDHIHWTALQHAVQKQHVDAVRALLEWGASPDAMEPGAINTPLFIATSHKDPAIVRLLLDAGADVNLSLKAFAQDEGGNPLGRLIARVLGLSEEHPSPKDALARMRATAAQSQP